MSLPPKADALAENVVVALVGADEDLEKAYIRDLGVSLAEFRRAWEWLREHNELYAQTTWDEQAAEEWRRAEAEAGGAGKVLPPALSRCVVTQRLAPEAARDLRIQQEGPAEAVVEGGGEAGGEAGGEDREPERFEYAAAVADCDCQNDTDRQFKNVEVSLRRWELRRAQMLQDEQRLRESNVESLQQMESKGAREQLRVDSMFLAQAVKRLDA